MSRAGRACPWPAAGRRPCRWAQAARYSGLRARRVERRAGSLQLPHLLGSGGALQGALQGPPASLAGLDGKHLHAGRQLGRLCGRRVLGGPAGSHLGLRAGTLHCHQENAARQVRHLWRPALVYRSVPVALSSCPRRSARLLWHQRASGEPPPAGRLNKGDGGAAWGCGQRGLQPGAQLCVRQVVWAGLCSVHRTTALLAGSGPTPASRLAAADQLAHCCVQGGLHDQCPDGCPDRVCALSSRLRGPARRLPGAAAHERQPKVGQLCCPRVRPLLKCLPRHPIRAPVFSAAESRRSVPARRAEA